ncbi:MAG TPA: hypothetical protein VH374_07015 [Polyangia bacterium]|jgi:hypothetical protein|nr:hypothetical protein [Polyangia bacterium]
MTNGVGRGWARSLLGAVALVLVTPTAADATDSATDARARDIQFHGFVSQGFLKTTANDYLIDSSRGSSEFSEAGVNATAQLTDKLRVGLQMFAYELGTIGHFTAKADWFYLDYRVRDWVGVRAGRLKIPYGLYNDVSDIDAARVPALLPSSVYPFTNREYLLAQTGGELYGYVSLGRGGALDYRAYGGAVPLDVPPQTGAGIPVTGLGVPYIAGFRLLWETPLDGLRIGASGVYLRVEVTGMLPPPTTTLNVKDNEYAGLGSIEYAAHDLLLAAEYGQTRVESHYDPPLAPDATVVSEGGYVLSAYRATTWLQPALYYSLVYPNRNIRGGRENMQHDLSGTLRFDINEFWIVKLEAHYMRGTASVAGTLQARAAMPENWGLFVLKTTAYF